MSYEYEWEKFIDSNVPKKDISKWNSNFGFNIISRDELGIANEVEFSIYLDNPKLEIYIVGDFNNWCDDLEKLFDYRLFSDGNGFGKVRLNSIKHNSAYKLLIVEDFDLKYFQDPASNFFDDDGNSIFWDYEDPSTYKQKFELIDTINRSTKILQTDLPGLIMHYESKKTGEFGGKNIEEKDYYKFIRESGVILEIAELGFNSIQFLPFAQAIDGNNWKFRYLIPFQFAIQKNWGNPDEFAKMIDEFHKLGIAVIGDFVVGHIPFKDYKIFGNSSISNGLHVWKKINKIESVYLKEETSWGTMRPDFDNPKIRDFFISSCLHFLKRYKIDGFRIDNVDGILRYGSNGDGAERPNGRTFLRDLNNELYSYNPFSLIHFEAHYFYDDNAKMLVVPFENDSRALGCTAYNESRLAHYFHETYMLKSADDCTVWKFKHLIDEKEWGQSNSTVSDFHNHDAAAGLMAMRCTGSYAFDAMTVTNPGNVPHAIGKIKVMEAIISLFQEGRTLDLLQSHLLQKGTFEHDSSIHWDLKNIEMNSHSLEFKKQINLLMDDSAFWPLNVCNRSFLNLDEKNKIMVIERFSKNSRFVILINISSWESGEYRVPVKTKNNYELVLNSHSRNLNISYENHLSNNFELIDRELILDKVLPYEVIVFKELLD